MDIIPHLVVPDAAGASDWYAHAFDATETARIPLPNGIVMTVELRLGNAVVHVASEFPSAGILAPHSIGGTATVLQISTDNADALWQRALDAGAQVHHPIQDQFWGERQGQLVDPFGHRWNIAQHIRDVPLEEMIAAAARAFGEGTA